MIAVDTNILVYAEGIDDVERHGSARAVMRRPPPGFLVIPLQALGELFNVLVRRGWPPARAHATVSAWHKAYRTAPTTEAAMIAALDLAAAHRLHIWDGVMMAVAADSGCRLLLSEDMQDGFTWGGVTVVNPFLHERHPLLELLLTGAAEDK